ncbi:DUF2268 domain-containing protein [Paenibacillus sp. NPDC057967]|uniref:DUF2268 domain-containing protein n=1 Tax=Paenibacillus sp. NPDC057967 TaxID=3346293 RepID=UPI0036DF0B7F
MNVPKPMVVEFTHQDRKFEIIPLYKEVFHYTASIKEDPSLDNKKEHYNKVFTPFYNLIKKRNLGLSKDMDSYFTPTLLEQQLEDNTIELLHNQDNINSLIKEAIISSLELLKGGNKTIFVMPLNPDNTTHIQEMGGVTGAALNQNVILLHVDPAFSEALLKYTVAREYNLTVALESLGARDYTLVNSVILEGKADTFASLIYPDQTVPWTEALSADSEQIVLDVIRTSMKLKDFTSVYQELHQGNYNKGIPMWSSYKLGFTIMQSYLQNNPEVTVNKWTRFKAEDIVKGSDYQDLLR